MAMATKRAVGIAMRMVGKDKGNGEGGMIDGDGNKEGNFK